MGIVDYESMYNPLAQNWNGHIHRYVTNMYDGST